MTLTAENMLTAAGVFVAILAALYSRWSALAAERQAKSAESALAEARAQSALAHAALQEARTQNELGIHAHRLDAYKAMLAFRSQVNAKAENFSRESVWGLWEHARLAEFYFPANVSSAMSAAVELAIKIQISVERISDSGSYTREELNSLRDKRDADYLQLADSLDKLNDDMRSVLRLVKHEL